MGPPLVRGLGTPPEEKGKEFRYEIVRKLDGQVYFAMSPTVEASHKVWQERRKNKRARID